MLTARCICRLVQKQNYLIEKLNSYTLHPQETTHDKFKYKFLTKRLVVQITILGGDLFLNKLHLNT